MSQARKLPKGYRVTVAPARVACNVKGFFEPRVWIHGRFVNLNPGAVFENRDKAREYGRELALAHAKSI